KTAEPRGRGFCRTPHALSFIATTEIGWIHCGALPYIWAWHREPVRRTLDAGRPAVQDVRVDHGRADVAVAEQLLDGADVVSGFEQVGRKRVAERVAAGVLRDAGLA